MMRIAAVGDVHLGRDARGRLRPHLTGLGERADVLLLAGDLTRRGLPGEAQVVAGEFADLDVPVVAVLGNHDVESGREQEVRGVLEAADIIVLEGEAVTLDTPSGTIGVAGTVGFGGGFPGGTCADFGEREMKAFVARGRTLAESLHRALVSIDADTTVALTHYAPVRDTLEGENPEIFPFLGSYLLAEAADAGGADLAVHGHAHHGTEHGRTSGGVPVRNVAEPVIDAAFRIYDLEPHAETATG